MRHLYSLSDICKVALETFYWYGLQKLGILACHYEHILTHIQHRRLVINAHCVVSGFEKFCLGIPK